MNKLGRLTVRSARSAAAAAAELIWKFFVLRQPTRPDFCQPTRLDGGKRTSTICICLKLEIYFLKF